LSKINIARDFSITLKNLQQTLDGYEVIQGEYPILVEALKGKITANDIKSFESNTGKKFPYKHFRNSFDRVFKNVSYFGTKKGLVGSEILQRVPDMQLLNDVDRVSDIKKELDILNFMYSLSNKSKDIGLKSLGDNPLFNNLTDNQVLFIKDFYNPQQTMLNKEFFGGPALNTKSNFFYSSGIPDVLNTKISRATKPLRTDVVHDILKDVDDVGLKEYTGTNMYHTFKEGLPTTKELTNPDKLPIPHYFYDIENRINNLIPEFTPTNKASVLRSMKLLNEILSTINNKFFPIKGERVPDSDVKLIPKVRGIQNSLENHLFRLVKNYNLSFICLL